MTEYERQLRERVDGILAEHRDTYGPDAPVVKIGLRVMQAAVDVERELAERMVPTPEAAERTGWVPETLQKYARAKQAGEPLPPAWAGLEVSGTPASGYLFALGSIPKNPRARAA